MTASLCNLRIEIGSQSAICHYPSSRPAGQCDQANGERHGVGWAQQLLTGAPTIEVASDTAGHDDGRHEMALPLDAPVRAPSSPARCGSRPDAAVKGNYRLVAMVARSAEVQFTDVVLGAAPVQQDLHFMLPLRLLNTGTRSAARSRIVRQRIGGA